MKKTTSTKPKSDVGAPPPVIPLTDWNHYFSWPSLGGLRHLVFHADQNGFRRVVRRAGGRVLICVSEFYAWVDANGGER